MFSNRFNGLIRLIVAVAGLFVMSCANQLNSDSFSSDGKYGSLSVSSEDASRTLDVSAISYVNATVFASDIQTGSEPCKNNIAVNGGTGSFEIENVPTGSNRIVQIQAFDSDGKEIVGGVIRKVLDVDVGTNECIVSRASTALGNVFYYLRELDYETSKISADDVSEIEKAIDSSYDFEKINTSALAVDFKAGGTSALKDKADYVLGGGEASNIVLFAKGYKYLWYWEGNESGTLLEMTAATDKGSDWYTATLNYASINLLFKTQADWNGNQTEDLSRTAGTWYYENGSWSGSSLADTTAPTVTWIRPSASTVMGSVELFAFATDESGIEKVEYYAGTTLLGTTDGASALIWDTLDSANGTYSVSAKAYDKAGNTAVSEPVSLEVSNTIYLKAVISNNSSAMATVEKTFDGSSSKGSITSYSWDFGDGTTGTGTKPTHTYSESLIGKSVTVTLTVTGTEDGVTKSVYDTQKVSITKKSDFQHRDFREETVYFMMTDRFADGDKTNNNIWGDEYLPNGESQLYDYDESKTGILSYYHGGDFKGIINNLDYIADMGFTAIWITPVPKQPEGRYYYGGEYEASAFHGYWAYDFDQIDPHLHSSGKNSDGWDDYKALIEACHAKGIRVMQDIVCNHGHPTAPNTDTKWYDLRNTVIMDGKTWTWETGDPYYDATDKYKGFFDYYGGAGIPGLIDFNESGPDGKDARQHLINTYKKYIDAGVDAFRIDTVAYMPAEWWGEFADTMYNYAKSIGNDYFYMVGEAWGGRGASIQLHSKDTTGSFHQLDMTASCMDYPGQMRSTFENNGNYSQFVSMTSNDVKDGLTDEDSTWSGMFVDNHDVARSNGWLNETQYKNALNYIYLFRGVPIVYYGTEAMYAWEGAKATTNKEDVCARWMLGDNGINYVKNNKPAMYKHLKVLNAVRHASECIQKGVQSNIEVSGDKAAITRTYGSKVAAVLLNKGGDSMSHSFTDLPSGSYTLYTSDGSGTLNSQTVSVSGSYSLSAPANGFAVLDPND